MDGCRRQPDGGGAVGEALGVSGEGVVESGLTDRAYLLDAAVEDVGGGEEGQADVVMVVVVPAEEVLEPAARVERAVEAAGGSRAGTSAS